jgi:2'-hydroxyisoflavone reductase
VAGRIIGMRLLILGGTVFVGRTVARHAVAAGHEVTCAARGVSGEPEDGVTFVPVDRDDPDGLAPLRGLEFDALVDVSSRPSHVRRAVADLASRVGHSVYVSTGSVYSDTSTPHQRAIDAPVLDAAPPEVDDPRANNVANYGPCKVACEQAMIDGFGADRTFVCRAGLIIGPDDPTGRFPYWVSRLARGGDVLAPGAPEDLVQYVDVRDLADWLILAAETRLAGVYDGIGAPVSREHFLTHVAVGVGARVSLTWVDQEFLVEQRVQPWSGERSLPLWLPLPEYGGFLTRDVTSSLEAGLSTRDVADTARDTLAWLTGLRQAPDGDAGLTAADEAALLEKWRSRTS